MQVHVQAHHRSLFRRLQGQRGVGGDGPRQLQRLVHQPVAGHDLVDQADLVGPLGRDVVAGQQHLHADGVGEEAGKYLGGGAAGDAPLDLAHAEDGLLGGDAHVGGHDQAEALAQGQAVDRGDDGFPHVDLPVVQEPGDAPLERAHHGAGLGHLLEVGAGAEGPVARPGDDGDAEAVICHEIYPRLLQRLIHAAAEGVAGLGPVDGDHGDAVVSLLVQDGCVGIVGHSTFLPRAPASDFVPASRGSSDSQSGLGAL